MYVLSKQTRPKTKTKTKEDQATGKGEQHNRIVPGTQYNKTLLARVDGKTGAVVA